MSMSVTDIQTQARQTYNAVGDTFFGDTTLNNFIWHGCKILARNAWLIERTYTTSTVASTQDYSYPTNTIAIKRVTVGGKKIKRITMRDDDAITLSNSTSTTSGYPIYYTDFNFTLSLRPIPDAVYTLKIYSFNDPQQITNTTSLEIPNLFQMDLVDYVVARMFGMDQNAPMIQFYMGLWSQHVIEAKRWASRKKRADGFATVQSEDTLPITILGEA